MSGRFKRGLDIADGSLDIFRANPRLALLPFGSLLLVGSAFIVLGGITLHYGLVTSIFANDLVRYAAIFAGLAVTSSLGAFFNAAVAHCAVQHFRGNDPSLAGGLRAAWRARYTIAAWAVVSATLGTVLYVLDEKFGFLGSAARLVFDLAWALLTFFVVPVIVIEDTRGLRDVLQQSGSAFKKTWGESVTATLGIGLALLPVYLIGIAVLATAYFSLAGPAMWIVGGVGLLVVVAGVVTSQVLGMVARTALYEYATADRRVGPFEDAQPRSVISDS